MKKFLIFLLAVPVTAVAMFYAWTNWSGARELRKNLAQLEAKNESLCIEDLIPPLVPDDQNVAAAPIFKEFFASEKDSRLGKLNLPWKTSGHPAPGENRLVTMAKAIDPAFSGNEAEAGRMVLGALAPLDPVLEELSEALRRPGVSWPLDYSKGLEMPFPHLTKVLAVARVLRVRALAELATGAQGKALEDTKTLFALARASSSPHFLICELVQYATLNLTCDVIGEGLRSGAWDDPALTAFSGILAPQNPGRQLADAFRIERAMTQQVNWSDPNFLKIVNQPGSNSETQSLKSRLVYFLWSLRPAGWANKDKALHLFLAQRMIESLGDGSRISPKQYAGIEAILNKAGLWERFTKPLAYISLPSELDSEKTAAFTATLLACTRTACAIERYRLANNRLPAGLDDLVPAFLPEVPMDPISGGKLTYKPSQDGSFVVYGIGWNEIDDGGAVLPDKGRHKLAADWGLHVTKL